MLELLAEEEISSDLQEKIAIARYSAGTLVRIIDDILDYSRIEAGMVEFQNELFPFRQTMKNVLASLRSKALEKELELSLFIDEAIPENLIGDQVRVSQIATNLIFNALKFTDEGHVHVFVKSKPVSPLQMQLLIEVQDTGIGIDEDRLEHIFEYFHQETMLTSQTYGGTGIGLTLSQELAQRMDGDITVESTKGKGSTFTASIILGLAENEAAQVAENIVPDHVVEYANSGCSGVEARVLLVEDDAVNQQVFLRFLAPYPVEVTVAENGEQAVEIFAKENFQVVLMDVRMPKMDGYDATRKIRQIERERKGKTPIIGLTAFAQERDRDRCMDAGMDMFLTKPIAKKAFLAALRSIIPYAISKDE
jgi:CheY-like chemotaxis protein